MYKRVLDTPCAGRAMGPYSVAVEANGFVYFSGQVAVTPDGGRAEDDTGVQTRQVMDNIGALLGDVGLGFDDIVKTTIFMADMADYADINTVYAEYFSGVFPARSAIQAAALPGGFRVEIEIVAARRSPSPDTPSARVLAVSQRRGFGARSWISRLFSPASAWESPTLERTAAGGSTPVARPSM